MKSKNLTKSESAQAIASNYGGQPLYKLPIKPTHMMKKGALISRNDRQKEGHSISDEGFDKYMDTPSKSISSKLRQGKVQPRSISMLDQPNKHERMVKVLDESKMLEEKAKRKEQLVKIKHSSTRKNGHQ